MKWTVCLSLGILLTAMSANARAEETAPRAGDKELQQKAPAPENESKEKGVVAAQPSAESPKVTAGGEKQVAEEKKGKDEGKKKGKKKDEKEEKAGEKAAFRVRWKDAFLIDTTDDTFRLELGGLVMTDWAFLGGDDNLKYELDGLENGVEFRRARLGMSGELYKRLEFALEYDFAKTEQEFKDVYVGLTGLPLVGNIRAGHFKEPFGLEELTSCKRTVFMERSLANEFTPGRNVGGMLYSDVLDRRMTWAVGGFRDTDQLGEGLGDYSVTARVTGLPWYQDKGRKLLHLGLDYTHRNVTDDILQYRSRPETDFGPWFVNTKKFIADKVDQFGGELAIVLGPLSFQGEYVHASVSDPYGPTYAFSGFYVMASYFLTGEFRDYKRASADFGGVPPKRNFLQDGGPGAWEIAARYSHIDLNDGYITGGELSDITLGVNWYLNKYSRIMWNYVHAKLDSVGDADVFEMRLQVHF